MTTWAYLLTLRMERDALRAEIGAIREHYSETNIARQRAEADAARAWSAHEAILIENKVLGEASRRFEAERDAAEALLVRLEDCECNEERCDVANDARGLLLARGLVEP